MGPDARTRLSRRRRTIAEALYVGLITDTGRFMYQNTTAQAHRMAAELIEAGVDVHELYRQVYEGVPYGKLALLARGLANVERYDGGRLTVTGLTAEDFAESGAQESYSEGVVDHLRALQGTAVAALVRDRLSSLDGDGERLRKVSLRSSDGRVDVSRIARAQGGGGHRQAAGFTTAMDWPELVAFLREEMAAAARGGVSPAERAVGRHPVRQAGRHHVARRGGLGAPRARARRQGRPRGHAGSVRHRAAARPGRPGHARPALPHGAAQDL